MTICFRGKTLLFTALAAVLLQHSVYGESGKAGTCSPCHREIAAKYSLTGMGRSFYRPSAADMVEGSYFHQPSNSHFAMVRRGGEYFQQRWQVSAGGQRVNFLEKRVDYVMGSGNHSRAYLHRTAANTLIELPLAWYSEKGGYFAMNPGYDRPDHDGFRRPITYDCMFCHNAYPRVPSGAPGAGAPAVYEGPLPEGIDCTRCHGAGERHIKLAGTAGSKRPDIRAAIINPARLPAERQLEVCMSCHLETTSFPLPNALQRYSRGPFSYQPGEPLADFILNFDHAPGTGHSDKFEIVNAVYRMQKSACYLQSGGAMRCTTCHNPHDAPRGQAAERRYNSVCRQCHSGTFDRRVAAGAHTAETGCIGCHMPKRRTEDVVRIVATDHLIVRKKPQGDLLAEREERHESGPLAYRGKVVPYYPSHLDSTQEGDLYLAVAQVKQGSNLAEGIPMLRAALQKRKPARPEFYVDLGEALEAVGQLEEAVAWYREAVSRNPRPAVELRKLGAALRRVRKNSEAVEVLRRSAALSSADPGTWHELGLAYRALGRGEDAVKALAEALKRDPDMPEAHNNLGIIRATARDTAGAGASFREAIRIRPDYADAHGNLANLLAGAGQFDEAREHFEVALRFAARDAATRYNYAMLLGRTRRFDDAQRELEEALRNDASFTDAHLLLADLLSAKGQAGAAMSHYREAVRLVPESPRANFGLGIALALSGDARGALPYLRKAAGGADPQIREQAQSVLKQLGASQ